MVTSGSAAGAPPLEVIVFPGGFNWPLFVAEKKGFFAAEGIAVNLTPTPDSQYQMVSFIDGTFDIAMTAIDNVIAYAEGQGAAPTQKAPDIVAVMGVDNGFLHLVATPDVANVAELRGRQVGVDALTTGYAFVLREMLALGGLDPAEFEYVRAGGVLKRFEALMNREFAATLLVSPFEAAAAREGFNILGNAVDVLGAYQGVVGAVRRDWIAGNEARLQGYIKACASALSWLHDPVNKPEAIAILQAALPNMAPAVAAASYDILLDPRRGFFRTPRIDETGVAKVLELRVKYSEPARAISDPAKYYDMGFVDAALS